MIVWLFLPENSLKNSLVPRCAFYDQLSVVSSTFKALLSVLCVCCLVA